MEYYTSGAAAKYSIYTYININSIICHTSFKKNGIQSEALIHTIPQEQIFVVGVLVMIAKAFAVHRSSSTMMHPHIRRQEIIK